MLFLLSPMSQPKPCEDCVAVHGDDPAAWLSQWPQGAEYRPRHDAWLCDGCDEERSEDLDPWSHGFSLWLEPC